jgi:hypothetical protein
VLIDSPRLLRVGDALALTFHVDGLPFLGSLRRLQTPMLKELRRVVDETPTTKLGFVVPAQSSREATNTLPTQR